MKCPSLLTTPMAIFDCSIDSVPADAGHEGKHTFQQTDLKAFIQWTDDEAADMKARYDRTPASSI